jgi:hypothetical protein
MQTYGRLEQRVRGKSMYRMIRLLEFYATVRNRAVRTEVHTEFW